MLKFLVDYVIVINLMFKILEKNYFKLILFKFLFVFIFLCYKFDSVESIFFWFIYICKKMIIFIFIRNKLLDLFKSYVYIYNK